MVAAEWSQIVAAAGGFGGVAALLSAITSTRTARAARRSADTARADTKAVLSQFKPDHGDSLRDKVDAVDKRTELLAQEVTLLANAVDQTNNLVRDRLKAHDREFARLRLDRDQLDV